MSTLDSTAHDDRSRSPLDASSPKRILVAELLAGAQEAILVHNGADYRLRITSKGRLILTK
ncbi:MAG: hemin uptake protein HemP [Hyphomicrobiaceae bacterium]|nr:hemin uptake protein HemP [Hyphomicrobiaceae bacterium]